MKNTGLADSPFFLQPAEEHQITVDKKPASERKSERTEIRTEIRSEKRTASIPAKRRTKRYSFEFYEDQLMKIKQLKYEAEMSGQRASLSDFAREAFDQYLKDK